MKVSVVVPNYNYGQFVTQAVESAFAQTYPVTDVIVIDDGSKDNSLEILTGLRKKFGERLRIVEQKNQGVSRARNRGVELSESELVAFVDADDFWSPDKIEKQVERFKSPKVGVVYCGVRYVDKENQQLGIDLSGMSGNVLREHALFRGTTVLAGGSTAIVRRACFDRVGGFAPELSTSADWDLWRRISCFWEVAQVAEPLVSYRLHSTAMHRNLDVYEHDMLLAFEHMFADPAASMIHPLKDQSYFNLYMTLAASNLHARRIKKTAEFARKGARLFPAQAFLYALGYPVRIARRRLQMTSNQSAMAGTWR